eukprot:364409-Chlamydomonas_euryale.AAC.2
MTSSKVEGESLSPAVSPLGRCPRAACHRAHTCIWPTPACAACGWMRGTPCSMSSSKGCSRLANLAMRVHSSAQHMQMGTCTCFPHRREYDSHTLQPAFTVALTLHCHLHAGSTSTRTHHTLAGV